MQVSVSVYKLNDLKQIKKKTDKNHILPFFILLLARLLILVTRYVSVCINVGVTENFEPTLLKDHPITTSKPEVNKLLVDVMS